MTAQILRVYQPHTLCCRRLKQLRWSLQAHQLFLPLLVVLVVVVPRTLMPEGDSRKCIL